jgi:hypothetical protein
MGDGFQIIVDREVSEDEAPRLAEQIRGWLIGRRIIQPIPIEGLSDRPNYPPGDAYQSTLKEPNPRGTQGVTGLGFSTKRSVFCYNYFDMTCRACGAQFEPKDEAWERWSEAAETWSHGDDSVLYACPKCGVAERLADWDGEFPCGFGNLGLEFWNWTPLSEQFIREVTEKLGHRIVLVRGKL